MEILKPFHLLSSLVIHTATLVTPILLVLFMPHRLLYRFDDQFLCQEMEILKWIRSRST